MKVASSLSLIVCLILSLQFFCHAEAPKESKLDAARDLLKTMEFDKRLDTGFDGMIPMIQQIGSSLNLNLLEQKQLIGIYKAWYTEDFDHQGLFEKTAQMYAEEFTVDELHGLNAFYQTPLGKKLQLKMSVMYAKSSRLGIQEGQAKQPLLDKRLDPFYEKIMAKRRKIK